MKKTELTGAKKALMDEYRKAIEELISVIKPLNSEQLSVIVDPDTEDPDCKSIQTILTHVVGSGYGYSVYIQNSIGLNTERPERKSFENVNGFIDNLNKMINYCEDMFLENPDLKIEEKDNLKKITVGWGQQYDPEQLMEHAIVHVLRHRRQIENFLKKQQKISN